MNSSGGPAYFERIESETGFTPILARLLEATPGAIGAALVDAEGEAVDYAGSTIDPFDIKVAAATFRIIVQEIELGPIGLRSGALKRLVIGTDERSYVIEVLPDGYALLTILQQGANFGHADRALDFALRDLYREAGWAAPPGLFRWHEIRVDADTEGRPVRVHTKDRAVPVHVIGKVAAGLRRTESGYRVGVTYGDCELTLVHALDEVWYADLPSDAIK